MKMSTNFNSVSSNSICEGCLSVDRNLIPIFDPNIKRFFQSIVEPLLCHSNSAHTEHPLALCWECAAIVRRIIKYQKQVQYAHEQLASFKLNYTTTLPCLSSLSTHIPPSDAILKLDDPPTSPQVTQALQSSETEPLAFIKVEQPEEDTGTDLEGYFVDGDEGEAVDDKDLKAVLKTDPFTYKEEKKTKRRSKRKSEVEFDESDDEPLKKRRELEEKGDQVGLQCKKVRRKKKYNTDEANSLGRNREKPAGVVDDERVARKLASLNVPRGRLQMLVLTWEQVEEERQKALQSVTYTRHDYRCEDCAVGFNHRFKLENHMKKHDPSAGPLVCAACRVRCRDAHALCAHRRRHRVRWRCTLCGELSSRAEVAADHHARAHGAAAPTHTCAVCGHTAPTLGKLRNHMKNHSERQQCSLCAKSFRDRASLRTHLFIHKGVKEYECPHCGKQFLFKKAMQVHLVTHDAPALLYCHQCDVNFKNRMSYYQHMKYNLKHIDPAKLKYACGLCDKKFAKAARLREHDTAVHLKATPVRCSAPGCAFACASRPVLRTHVRMVHRNVRAARNHVCHTCGKAYSTKKTLEGHMRSHTGERPFACAHCASTFAYEAALYNHNKLVHLKAKSGRRAPARAPPAAWPPPPAPVLDQSDLTLPR